MKGIILLLFLSAFICLNVFCQKAKPCQSFQENPLTHNVHICFDGSHYYTINGGLAENGRVNKYNSKFELTETYYIKLDMRTIVFNPTNKKFFVSTYGADLLKINNLKRKKYKTVVSFPLLDKQTSFALSPDGKFLYALNEGILFIYDFKTHKLVKTISGFRCGEGFSGGAFAVAVSDHNIFCWDAATKLVYIYDLDGKFIKTKEISSGEFGVSLSCAGPYLWVASDGNYETGTWYAYEISELLK